MPFVGYIPNCRDSATFVRGSNTKCWADSSSEGHSAESLSFEAKRPEPTKVTWTKAEAREAYKRKKCMRYLECTETEIIEGTKTIVIAVPDDMTQDEAIATIGKERLQAALDELEYSSCSGTETTFEWSDEEPEDEPDFDLTEPLPAKEVASAEGVQEGYVTQQMVDDYLSRRRR
jgi:hypothetical protein